MSIMSLIDDKHVPLYRIMWISALPHFCGEDDCLCEGKYEVRLDQGEAVWANVTERDEAVKSLERWRGGLGDQQWDSEP
jgi:hypothetical protein